MSIIIIHSPSYNLIRMTCLVIRILIEGCLGGSSVEHLPLAQVVIPGSWDGVPPPPKKFVKAPSLAFDQGVKNI